MKTINGADALVNRYMAELDHSLSTLPVQRREEILTEVAHHIEEGRALLDVDDEQSVSALLDRIGDPSFIATEAGAAPPAATSRPLLLVLSLIALGLGIVAVLLAALAFSHSSGSAGPNPQPLSPLASHAPTPASRSKWAAEGARLVHAMMAMHAHSSDGDFAYQSAPVNITHDGTYTLDYGPVDDHFVLPVPHSTAPGKPITGFGIAFDFPSDASFQTSVDGGGSVVTLNGHRYFQERVAVSNLTTPYPDFTGWIYP